ncbi:hypothetical protein [Methylomonas sp. LWB]|uniref:hypothetical protein n=1 Tax=Methylomonas sp. LWB TaxID=1905845 RepID=UPI0011152565|nr:hypothetical protein [Methylomonas sp. LWB]
MRSATSKLKDFGDDLKDVLNKLIPLMVRQTLREPNQANAVNPEPVEALKHNFLNTADASVIPIGATPPPGAFS